MVHSDVISPILRPNRMPQKGVAIPKFDLASIWEYLRFDPHDGQKEIMEGWKVHEVTTAVCGTRFGKSKLGAHLPMAYIAPCLKEEIKDGKRRLVEHRTNGAIIAPFFRLTAIIMNEIFSLVVKLCRGLGYSTGRAKRTKYFDYEDDVTSAQEFEAEPGTLSVRRVNGVIQTIVTPWGNRIDAFTMENPKALLGQAFDWIITDESGQFTNEEWNDYFEYADRARLDRKGWVYHGTTPRGFTELYDKFYLLGQAGPQRNGDYISFQMQTHRNTHLDVAWLEKQRKTTPKRIYERNYMAQFNVMEGQVYEEFDHNIHVRAFKSDAQWWYFLSMDFGFNDPFACQLMAWTGEAFVVIDEVYQKGLTTGRQKQLVSEMVKRHVPRGAYFMDQRKQDVWTVWGDPRGAQQRAEWSDVGVPVRKPKMKLKGQRGEIEATAQIVAKYFHPVEDRPFPAFLKKPGEGLGAPQLFIHERCKNTILSIQTWVKKDNSYAGPDHLCDSLRYAILGARKHAVPLPKMRAFKPHLLRPKTKNRIPTKLLKVDGKPLDIGLR